MSENIPAEVAAWAEDQGWSREGAERIKGGTNNRIYRLWGKAGSAALKIYYRGAKDPRDRFGAERDFYTLCERAGGVAIPRRLGSSEALGAAIFEWAEGSPLQAPVTSEDLSAAGAFLRDINGATGPYREGARIASEACFDAPAHFALLDRRLSALEAGAAGIPELASFVGKDLQDFRRLVGARLLAGESRTPPSGRIFSPGDFGFHNAMRRAGGEIIFFDFEYSGWDDPVKTVADIFLQPEKPVALSLLEEFCHALTAYPGLADRARLWLPFFALKWCCILLNPAVLQHAERREFAGEAAGADVVARQLAKARHMLQMAKESL